MEVVAWALMLLGGWVVWAKADEVSAVCLQSSREYARLTNPATAPYYLAMQWASGHAPNDLGTFSNCDPGLAHQIPSNISYGWCTGSYRVANLAVPVVTGMCVPRYCTAQEMQNDTIFQLLIADTETIFARLLYTPGSASVNCVSDQPKPLSVASVQWCLAFVCVLALFCTAATLLANPPVRGGSSFSTSGLLPSTIESPRRQANVSLLSSPTSYKEILSEEPPSDSCCSSFRCSPHPFCYILHSFLACWSLPRNLSRLLAAPPPPAPGQLDLGPLNGLRFLAMSWVILGHALIFKLAVYSNRLYVFTIPIKTFVFQAVSNGTLSTDVFFLLSGFLGAHLLLQTLRRNGGKLRWPALVFSRWTRLLPAMLFWMLCYWQVAPYLTYGPIAYQLKNSAPDKNCNKYWWTNALFIQNLYPGNLTDMCFNWTWYLANDFQFSIVVLPVVVWAYWKNPKWGWATLALMLVGCFSALLATCQVQGFQAGFFDLANPNYMDLIYIKPWMRAPAYLVGPLLAFALDHERHTFRLSKAQVFLCTVCAVFLMAFFTYIPLPLNRNDLLASDKYVWPQGVNSLYLSFSRFGFCVGLALIMWMLTTRQQGYVWLGQVLGTDVMAPLAKLTYGAYLVHETWMLILYYSLHAYPQYSSLEYVENYVVFIVFSYVSSFVCYLLWEKPAMNLVVLALKSKE
eukprot:gb/GEZN01002596.1/.p1 GENE.gb/GEZN01002596.1/~~gb/GEZN01002596.1/.p1  ORF type:complete len:685 (-),score=86.95 gb/GEZN01002596.1/:357-2411(-)